MPRTRLDWVAVEVNQVRTLLKCERCRCLSAIPHRADGDDEPDLFAEFMAAHEGCEEWGFAPPLSVPRAS